MDLWAFLSASLSLKPSFLWSVKFDPSSVSQAFLVERQQWDCRDILVLEPLLESGNGVRIDRGWYVIAVILGNLWCTAELRRLPDRHGA